MDRRITAIATPVIERLGYALVRVQVTVDRNPTVQIMAERIDGTDINIDECARISREISAVIDIEDPLPYSWQLEVSSPGLDRPLTRPADYVRFAGRVAKMETTREIDGQHRFKGVLNGTEEDTVLLSIDEKKVRIPLETIKRAKLVITDDIFKAVAKGGPEPDAE
ncbi:MAG: ribosome maturation factor RimP [Pseudomonadota bacterium]|nr:ribosome maturation factor RimP [Pseudomonadota bacterium]